MAARIIMLVSGLTAGCGPLVEWWGDAVLLDASSVCMTSQEIGSVVAEDVYFVYENCVDSKPVEARLSATIDDASSAWETLEVDVELTEGECSENYADHPEDGPVLSSFDLRGSKGRHRISGMVEDWAGGLLSSGQMGFLWAEWELQRPGEPGCSWTLLLGERPAEEEDYDW